MSFDRLAPVYHWMERLLAGGKLQRCRTAFLSDVPFASRILLAGEGHGRFLECVLKQFPAADVTVLDSSGKMLKVARQYCGGSAERVQFIHCDCRDWEPEPAQYDLVATHFFLDCFSPETLAIVIPRLAHALRPGGAWLLSDFRIPEEPGWQRLRARIIHRMMYAFFRPAAGLTANRVTPPDRFMSGAGMVLINRQLADWGLLHSDLWQKRSRHPNAVHTPAPGNVD